MWHDAKNYEKAIEQYTFVLDILKFDKVSKNNLVAAYYELKEYEKALEQGLDLIKIDNDYPNVHRHVARAYFRMGNFEKFKEHIDLAIKLNPKYSLALMVSTLFQNEDIKKALLFIEDTKLIKKYFKDNQIDEK